MGWLYEAERKGTPWFAYIVVSCWNDREYSRRFCPFPKKQLFFFKDHAFSIYLDEDEVGECSSEMINRIKSRAFDYKAWMEKASHGADEVAHRLKGITGLRDLPDRGLTALADDCVGLISVIITHTHLVRVTNKKALEELRRLLPATIKDREEAVAILSSTDRPSFFAEYEEELCRLGPDATQGQLRYMRQKWEWITVGYADEAPLSIEKIKDDLAHCRKVDKGTIRKQREAILAKAGLSAYGQELAFTLSDMCFLKDHLRRRLQQAMFYSRPIFEEVAKRLHVSRVELMSLFPHEMRQALLEGKVEPGKLARKILLFRIDNGKWDIYEGREAEDRFNALVNIQLVDEVHGTVAYAGKARGRVVVIRTSGDMVKAGEGIVIVSPMTTPELMPVLKKAVAIVTDEGGLTSHAAIVSREFGLPCIVGTRIATKIFHDGDMVEVDAEMGVVRKV